jgi:hypothetical protein
MESVKWVVGAEYDDAVLAGLGEALRNLGFEMTDNWAGMAGSQDIAHWNFRCPDGSLVVEVETYVGVTVEGPPWLVSALRAAFQAMSTPRTPAV